jgi:hypothetical protein
MNEIAIKDITSKVSKPGNLKIYKFRSKYAFILTILLDVCTE